MPEVSDPTTSAAPAPASAWRRMVQTPGGLAGCLLVAGVVAAAIVGPVLHGVDPTQIGTGPRMGGLSADNLLGTDALGRDTLARTLASARVSLMVGLGAIAIGASIGTLVGVVSGFFGGWVDSLLMRIMDVLLAFPAVLLALLTIAVLGPSSRTTILAVGIVYIPALARVARAPVLGLMHEPFIGILRVSGASGARIMFRHVIPNTLSPVTVQATISLSYAILIEASLSYLGLGVQPPASSWGAMISEGQRFITTEPRLVVVPCIALGLTIIGFNLLGDRLRDVLDPRMSARR